ncbi:gluconate 2-dehydrogenase subunit 3 family protein [Rhizobium leucaenae]|uniref:Gluconate 2-dehydrogenase gamma chain n=1 Tax=Rhizobium leucaenae TaxID=29450 RepID=A0A7W6ZVF7_9HYPH|nr:gluconate 2-dehydrogenase subunit 3 family protein [Rhizobium leucaenae]MBB4569389.1 gluconate 2-dehydrogenase gamma chain [Rhizobium leucaenae]MBB6302843.1 gluconate 2-dehydrogenase gamma chain [Rhizobium leucaenae]
MEKTQLTRRLFLGGGVVSIAAGTQSVAETIKGHEPWLPHQADKPSANDSPTYRFFSPKEVEFMEAATERICPHDELGPGAKECRVALFIDHQLAGGYGRADSWYMQGPWSKGQETQGYQSRLSPSDMYRTAIAAIEKVTAARHGGQSFAALSPDDQDAILQEIESGKAELEGADAKTFFKMLLLNTKEGMFCDPIYGGNKDMAGWKMIGFPGARYDYRDWVGRHGERYSEPPVGIAGRPDWNQQS